MKCMEANGEKTLIKQKFSKIKAEKKPNHHSKVKIEILSGKKGFHSHKNAC